ncbi:MAG: CerR family C-terminal domain-containing protein [Planctomycetota bacterium]|jgi:AcrR family transcriptional regulator
MSAPSNNISQVSTGNEVTTRLLNTAEDLFAQKGFDATSIRDITKAANCNVAAVNYYYSSKYNLYAEVFRRRLIELRQIRLESIEKVMSQTQPPPTLTELIRSFSNAFLEPLLDHSTGQTFLKLMVREMNDPRLTKDMFVNEIVTPTLTSLGQALNKLCPHLDQKQIILSIISIVGQLVHVIRIHEMFDMNDFLGKQAPTLTEIVDHIVEFSTTAIQEANKRNV